MTGTQIAKLVRDLYAYRGRLGAMFAAVAASLIGVGSILVGYSILSREVSRSYLSTRPAHATLDLGAVDPTLVAEIERLPYVAAAEARSTVGTRMRAVGGEWTPLRLFVLPTFDTMRLSLFRPEKGAWPPPEGTILVERSSAEVLPFEIGQVFEVVAGDGPAALLSVSGTVHDAGLAPAWQEQTVWGYATLDTFKLLGGPALPEEVKVLFDVDPRDDRAILARTRELSAWLLDRGVAVHAIQVPPAGLHPHQGQMTSIVRLFLIFGILILVSSAILVATLLSGLLEKETRGVGILKTLGAGPGGIMIQYLTLVWVPLAASLAVSIPLGIVIGRAMASSVTAMLNLGAIDDSLSALPIVAQAASGLLLPSLFCMAPLARLVALPIRKALTYTGTTKVRPGRGAGRLSLWLGRRARWLSLSTRNLFRKRWRLSLTLGLLGSAGMLFLATSNLVASQSAVLESTFRTRSFDYEVRLGVAVDRAAAAEALARIAGVAAVESWPSLQVERPASDGLPLSRVYPDGGHGSLVLRGVPDGSAMAGQQPVVGNGLQAIPVGSLVLNRGAWSLYGQPKVGAAVEYYLEGQLRQESLSGVVSEIGPAAIYVSQAGAAAASGWGEASNTFRLRSADAAGRLPPAVQKEVEAVLRGMGATVRLAFSETAFREALTGHTQILTFSLYFLSVLLGIVGLLGLSSALGASVAERRRELGVMRAMGATPGVVARTILVEALALAALSLGIGLVLSLPLSSILGAFLGRLSFRQPFPLTVSVGSLLAWVAGTMTAASLAALAPARSAGRLSVREALAYE